MTNIPELDKMLCGKGLLLNSITMISGQSCSGKSLLTYNMMASALSADHRVLYVSFEEAPEQIKRNAKLFGDNLEPFIKKSLLSIVSIRSVELGMEEHVISVLKTVDNFDADFIFIDPKSSLSDLGDSRAFKNVVLRLAHALKRRSLTVILTELQNDNKGNYSTLNISSIADNCIRLMLEETDSSIRRLIKIHKARGILSTNSIREKILLKDGLTIIDV